MNNYKKKFIWFDIGYTLLKLNREVKFQGIIGELGFDVKVDEIEMAFHLTDKLFMRRYPGVLGKNRDYYMPMYLGNLLYTLGLSTALCPLFNRWKEKMLDPFNVWEPFDHVYDELVKLKNEGYGLGVISNWDNTAVPILEMHKIASFFDPIIISSEVGCEKPNPEIFNIAMEKASVSAHECLYVGDNYYDDAVGSRKVGMDCVILNPYGSLGVEEIEGSKIVPDITCLKDFI